MRDLLVEPSLDLSFIFYTKINSHLPNHFKKCTMHDVLVAVAAAEVAAAEVVVAAAAAAAAAAVVVVITAAAVVSRF